jgi:hypothetical protein
VHHVTIEFKICDKRARDPVSGKLIFDETTEKGNLQAAAWCFPCMIIIAKYNKGTYDKYFREIFDFCSKVRKEGINGWKSFRIYEPQDMTSTQMLLDRGGAAKIKKYFCHLCHCDSHHRALPNQVLCPECSPCGLLCYHHKICDGDCIASAEQELACLKRTGTDLMATCRATYYVRDDRSLDWEAFYADCSLHMVGVGKGFLYMTPARASMKYNTW